MYCTAFDGQMRTTLSPSKYVVNDTLPSNTTVCAQPAATLVMPLKSGGNVDSPYELAPHKKVEPSEAKAILWEPPPAINLTSDKSVGTITCLEKLLPQAMSVPSLLSASVCVPPAAIAITLVRSGCGAACP